MTLPLAIRPRIRLRDEPERSRAAWAPPMALPVAAYWVVMGLLTYGVSKAPFRFESEEARPEQSAVDGNPARQPAWMTATRAEAPPAPNEPPAVQQEAPPARDETQPARKELSSIRNETPTVRNELSVIRSEAPRVRNEAPKMAEGSRRNSRRGASSRDTLLALHGDPVPEDSFSMRGVSVPSTTFVDPAAEAPPAVTRRPSRATSNLPTCESAVAAATTEWDLSAARGAPDLSREAYATVLERGAYLSECGVPSTTTLDICAAVQNGRAVGITVVARPANAQVSGCVKAAVESLSFPSHSRLDVTRTHFEAASSR